MVLPPDKRRGKSAKAEPLPNTALLEYSRLGKLELVEIGAIVPYANNARVHTDRGITLIMRSIESNGFITPILIDQDNNLIAGHGRVEAAKRLGMTQLPALRHDHLSAAQVHAYRIIDNRHAELSGWNREMLAIEYQFLTEIDLGFNVETIGFSMGEIDILMSEQGAGSSGEDEGEVEPDPSKPAVTRLGDVWLCGRHRMLCGSSLSTEAIATVLGGKSIDMAIEDPPYNVSVTKHVGGLGKTQHREFAQASGEMSDPQFQSFLTDHMTVVAAAAKPGAVLMEFMDWRSVAKLIAAGQAAGLEMINLAVWAKTNGGMGSLYRSQHELCVIFKKPGASITNNVELGKHGRYRTNLWTMAGQNSFGATRMDELTMHPTVKPVALVADAILDVTKRGELVFDGFLGSGTTLIACERKGRLFSGIDLDPLYVDCAVRRWQRETGQHATLEATGQTFAEVEADRAAAVPAIEAATEPKPVASFTIRRRTRPTAQAA